MWIPSTRLPEPLMTIPEVPLPETTLRASSVGPPTMLKFAPVSRRTPACALPRAPVPEKFTPMRLPRMRLRWELPARVRPTPLPESTLFRITFSEEFSIKTPPPLPVPAMLVASESVPTKQPFTSLPPTPRNRMPWPAAKRLTTRLLT